MRRAVFSVALIVLFLKNTFCVPTTTGVQLTKEKISTFKEIASKITETVNADVDPCFDYNEYICGHFDEEKIVSKSEIATNELFDDTDLKEILAKYLPRPEDMNDAEKKMQNFLNSCKNKDNQDIKQFVKDYNFPDAIGGWPAFESNWNGENFDLVSAIAEFELFAHSILVNSVFKDRMEGRFGIRISPKRLYVPDDEDIYKETAELRKKLLQNYGVTNTDQVNNDIIHFEKEYSSVTSWDKSEEPQEITYEILKEKLPEFDWDKYFEIILGKILDNDTPITLENLGELKALLAKVQKMESRIVANYLFYVFVNRLNTEFRENESCYRRLFLHFESVISRLVVKNLYTDDYMTYLLDMVQGIVDTLRDSLHDFNGKTTEDIMGKIENFLNNEYLPNLTEDRIIKLYSKLQMNSSDFYGNTLRLFRYYMKLWLQSFMEGKNIGMKVINRRIVSYIFIRAIYEYYRKPSPVLFDLIATPLLRRSLNMLAPDQDYDDKVKECFQRQLNISQDVRYGDLVSVKAVEVYLRSFDKWAEKNPDIIAAENEVFKEFGLSVKKILLAIHVQSSCRYREMNDQSYLRKLFLSALPNLKDFSEEFGCPIGTPMHPRERCQIP